MLSILRPDEPACRCEPTFDDERLLVDANDCPGTGDLVASPACRATVVAALERRTVEEICTRATGIERAYEEDAAGFLVAAGRYADAVAFHDGDGLDGVRRDPLTAAREAVGRGSPYAEAVVETGLADFLPTDYETVLRYEIGPTIARTRVTTTPPAGVTLTDTYELETGACVRIYEGTDPRTYQLVPAEHRLDPASSKTLATAYEHLARGTISGGERAPMRAVRSVATEDTSVETLGSILRKHTSGLGIFEDWFADPDVTDAFATAPVTKNRISIRRAGETYRTNVRLTERGAASLASRFRRSSGRAFSRASPTLDAVANVRGRRIRVAGVTRPVSDGLSFALRAHDEESFRLSDLVDNGTLPPDAAALLSIATKRGAAILLAGPRSAGKTTTLGALLWELSPSTRTIVIQDTPELPLSELQSRGRDVLSMHVDTDDGGSIAPDDALHTALRLGDGALVIGEVRGAEARVLYEAMRVGAADGAVLGTIHGEGAETVRERVVTDLGVPESAFADTDLIVSLATDETDRGKRRRLDRIETVRRVSDGVEFEPIHDGERLLIDDATPLEPLAISKPCERSLSTVIDRRTSRFDGR